jgi:hypothetical protein
MTMKRTMTTAVWGAVLAAALVPAGLHATEIDSRLAKVRKAHVVALDELGEDVAIVSCFVEQLPKLTPITVVSLEEADVVLRVQAHLPSTTTKVLVGVMGGSPSAHVYAELPDGTKLWDDGTKYRRSMMKQGQLGASGADTAKSIECGLADGLIEKMRNAMREARGK